MTVVRTTLAIIGMFVIGAGVWAARTQAGRATVNGGFDGFVEPEASPMATLVDVQVHLGVSLSHPIAVRPREGFEVVADVSLDSVAVIPPARLAEFGDPIQRAFAAGDLASLELSLAGATVEPRGPQPIEGGRSRWSVLVANPATLTGFVRIIEVRTAMLDTVPYRLVFSDQEALRVAVEANLTAYDRAKPLVAYFLGSLLTLPGLMTWGVKWKRSLQRRRRRASENDSRPEQLATKSSTSKSIQDDGREAK